MTEERLSEITAGKDGEDELAAWSKCQVRVRQLPPDEHGILRISIGGGETPVPVDYCSFRGDRQECIRLLRRALKALQGKPL
jgi:hypothetical protein